MTPEQMQAMAANASPEMIQQAQDMMKNMSPEQLQNMQRMAASMGMAPPAGGMPSMGGGSAREKYMYDAAMLLKNEGNALHGRGDHHGAIKKYEHARSNLEGHSSAQSVDLRKACILNTAMCHLKLEAFRECEKACSEVIKTDASDLKALYRRGQAYMGLKSWAAAKRDLQQAVKLAANDPVQLPLIQSKLEQASEHCKGETCEYRDGDVIIEDITDEPEEAPSASSTAAQVPSSNAAATTAPVFSEAQRAAAARMAEENPEHLQQMADMMENMSDAEFEHIRRASGMPNMDRNMARQAAGMMKAMSPEQLKSMAQMAAQMRPEMGGAAPASSSAGDVANAANMMRDMPPEQLQAAAAAAGMDLSPDMIKVAMDAMKNMSPEDMANMQKMASQRGVGGQGAPGMDPANMMSMMKDPKAMDGIVKMMKGMDEDALVNMLKMSQPNLDEASARKAAQSMKGLDERSMKMMMWVAGLVNSMHQQAQQAKAWAMARPGIIIAFLLLIVALLLRYFDIV